jgi:hypothetical protein
LTPPRRTCCRPASRLVGHNQDADPDRLGDAQSERRAHAVTGAGGARSGRHRAAWRWVLILGLRDLRANSVHLGQLASDESPNGTGWSDDSYVYGPLVHGLTAAAVNECAQHCEDLFATLRLLRERLDFARRMLSYNAGSVTQFGMKLRDLADDEVRRLFLVPGEATVEQGLADSVDPSTDLASQAAAVTRLVERVRRVSDWYETYEDFHVQYKHGLKLAMRPYGKPTREAIEERRVNLRGALLAFTSEPISKMLQGPQQQQGMIFPNLIPEARAHLNALVEERAMLRYKMSGPEVDLNDVAEVSGTVAQLLLDRPRSTGMRRIDLADPRGGRWFVKAALSRRAGGLSRFLNRGCESTVLHGRNSRSVPSVGWDGRVSWPQQAQRDCASIRARRAADQGKAPSRLGGDRQAPAARAAPAARRPARPHAAGCQAQPRDRMRPRPSPSQVVHTSRSGSRSAPSARAPRRAGRSMPGLTGKGDQRRQQSLGCRTRAKFGAAALSSTGARTGA